MKNKRLLIILVILAIALTGVLLFVQKGNQDKIDERQATSDESRIEYYTCGMHPSVRVSPEEYEKGKTNCPICNMNLTPVYSAEGGSASGGKEAVTEEEAYYGCGMEGAEHVFQIKVAKPDMTCPICGMPLIKLSKEEADKLKGVASRVKIKGEELRLAGVKTEPVRKLHLYKEIRTVGKVAYDPQLAIAQEEFISSLKALDKIREGKIPEIEERALNLVESSKRKLRLLGLSEEQISGLERKREIQTSLILPEEKMWIYGDVYEYELSWVKVGEKVKVTSTSLPGEEFPGVISSINPVLNPRTRSVMFRAEVDNPDLRLKPEMYVDIIIMSMYTGTAGERMVLAIPKDSVLDTGRRKIVWVDAGGGEYEGRIVKLGPEATSQVGDVERKFYPVLKGLAEGEDVVTKANFLIDSQSQLTGVAAGAYGGALGVEEDKRPPVHQH